MSIGGRAESLPAGSEADSGCSKVALGGVPEFQHQRVLREDPVNDGALHADATPVDQPNLAETTRCCGIEVVPHDICDVARLECVKVEGILDRNPDDVVSVAVHRAVPAPA